MHDNLPFTITLCLPQALQHPCVAWTLHGVNCALQGLCHIHCIVYLAVKTVRTKAVIKEPAYSASGRLARCDLNVLNGS